VTVVGVLEDVVIKAKSAADYVGTKTGEIVEISRLKIQIAEIEGKLHKEYYALGKTIYNAAKDESDCSDFVKNKVEIIDGLSAQLDKLNEKLTELKGRKKCESCSYVNPEEANYCLKCGAKL
jgi:hypothetical protein